MRKRVFNELNSDATIGEDWLDLEPHATIEVTSEDAAFPVESALTAAEGPGWRAAGSGPQTLRIVFDHPRPLRRMRLEFDEPDHERTQEFVLRSSASVGEPLSEIVRQQWNFSPRGGTNEIEDLRVELPAVAVLELAITPDIAGGSSPASLRSLRLA